MFKEVRACIPSMAAWLESCYGSQPFLHLDDHTILSCCGVQQGDPLGPLCFALSLHPIIERIKEEVPGLLINAWYLDDGTLCGSVRDLGRLQGQRLGVPPAESIRHLFQRCAIAIWRGNASMWIRRLRAHPPVVDGIL